MFRMRPERWYLRSWDLRTLPGTRGHQFRSLEFYPFYPMEEETGSSGKGQAQVSENQGSKSHESCIEITVVLYRISLHPPVPRSIPSSCRMLRKPITNPDKRIPGFNGNSEQPLSGTANSQRASLYDRQEKEVNNCPLDCCMWRQTKLRFWKGREREKIILAPSTH